MLSQAAKQTRATGLSGAGNGRTVNFFEATADFAWGRGFNPHPDRRNFAVGDAFSAPPGALDARGAFVAASADAFDPERLRPFRSGGIYMASTVDASCRVRLPPVLLSQSVSPGLV